MKIVHTMIRVNDLDESLKFYCDGLGMKLLKKRKCRWRTQAAIATASPARLFAFVPRSKAMVNASERLQ